MIKVYEYNNKQVVYLNDLTLEDKSLKQIVAGEKEASLEKHIPHIVSNKKNTLEVAVGSVEHPMVDAHYIEWVLAVFENNQYQIKTLKPNEKPVAKFIYAAGSKPLAVYAYCNLHGLWMVKVK